MPPRLRGARYTRGTNRARGPASIARSKSATPTRWQSVVFVIPAHTTSARPTRSTGSPKNVALARIKTGVPSQFLVPVPRDGAIIFADLIGKLDALYVHCTKCSRAGLLTRTPTPTTSGSTFSCLSFPQLRFSFIITYFHRPVGCPTP
jgi:hypothetical protein